MWGYVVKVRGEGFDSLRILEKNSIIELFYSRPTTRTTKTISDTSSSSCSSTADKSAMREYQIESYISFQSHFTDQAREAIDHVDSPDDTIASDKIFSDPGDVTTYFDNCDSVSKLHETHFGDSFSDIPRTMIHSPLVQDSLPHGGHQRTVIHSPIGQDSLPHWDHQRTVIHSTLGQDSLPHGDHHSDPLS